MSLLRLSPWDCPPLTMSVHWQSLFPWSQGRIHVWDFTCSDTLAWSHVISTSKEAGKSAQDAEKEKQDHYHYLLQDYIFTPVAAETMGSWGPIGLKFIKDLGTRIKEKTGERRSTAYLFQSLGMAIQRGNAASVIGTLPRNKKLDEIYLLWSNTTTWYSIALYVKSRNINNYI